MDEETEDHNTATAAPVDVQMQRRYERHDTLRIALEFHRGEFAAFISEG